MRWLAVFICVLSLPVFSMTGGASKKYDALIKSFHDDVLFVSNYPESIRYPGAVLDYTMEKPGFRLMYHHRNVATYPLFVTILVTNLDKEDTTVDVYRGEGGPSSDIVFVGHRAAYKFMNQLLDSPDKMVIPGQSTMQVLMHSIKPDQTASGLFRLVKEASANIQVKMILTDPEYGPLSAFSDIPDAINRFRVGHFSESIREESITFNTTDLVSQVSVGSKPYLKDVKHGTVMKGNYALMYAFNATVVNTDTRTRRVRLFVEPTKENGLDRAILFLNGNLIETGLLTFKNGIKMAEKLTEFELDPGESRVLKWFTFPQAGCFYPVDYVFKTVD